MGRESSLPPEYFEGMYAGDPDPWGFETSPYEQAKYDFTIAALGDRRYARGLEIGCANGVLSRRLAGRAEALLAVDVSETALARAKRRCADLAAVRVKRMAFPRDAPDETFDLVVCSEVAYYWSDADLAAAGAWLRRGLVPGGDLLMVHWTGETDYPQTADAAMEGLALPLDGLMDVRLAQRTADYRLDLWRRL